MRIALIAPIAERVPPKLYGGTERVIYTLTEELVRKGHQVTLFATGDSITSAKLSSVFPISLREAKIKDLYGLNPWTMLHIGVAYSRQNEFDIIHDHLGFSSLPTANLAHTPSVMTFHGPIPKIGYELLKSLNSPYVVSISKSQIMPENNINYAGMVYNGLKMEKYPYSTQHEGYLLFVGRISREKGVHYAIRTALKLNLPLIIAAKLDEVERPYFYRNIKPYLSEQIRWIGEVDESKRNQLMSRALCFLHPVTWPEPFGLTLIESMACGCPVVAFNHGSIPEIVKDGKTGFVVKNVPEMITAVNKIDQIDRTECRTYALENFNAEKMTDAYEKIYESMIQKNSIRKASTKIIKTTRT